MYSFGQKILDIVFTEYGITLPNIDFCLSYPPKPDLGDFAFSCYVIAKEIKANPNEIATRLATLFDNDKNTFASASSMGGYVNFHLNNSIFIEDLYKISLNDKPKNNKMIVVDYFSANMGKPLHIGHLCTPSLGQTIINVYKYLGYNVIGDNHLGDWGGIFGKLIAAYKLYGNEEELNKNPIEYLVSLYIRITTEGETNESINEMCRLEFKKLSEGDLDNINYWHKFTKYSLDEANRIIRLLNVEPTYAIGESFYEGLNLPKLGDYPDLKFTMQNIVEELLIKGVATKNQDGSVGVVFPEETKLPSCVLQKKDGTNLYLTSDIACIKYRLTNGWNASKILYFTDVRQQLHFKQLFYIAKQVWPELKDRELAHVFNGFVKLKEGMMSTRKGNFIMLKDLIEEGYNRTDNTLKEKGRELSPENIKAITIGAIKYSYLSQDREKDIVFDWDKALSFEGNSGPYIQYAYVRASNLFKNSGLDEGKLNEFGKKIGKIDINLSQYDKSLIKKLSEFEGKIQETANKYKPHIIAQYCYELASEFNSFYVNTPRILEEKDENLRNIRLTIIYKIKEVLLKGFELLAIDMPDEM